MLRVSAENSPLADAILDTVGLPLLVLDGALRIKVVNTAFLRHFQVSNDDTAGKLIYELGNGQWDIPELRKLLGDILPQDSLVTDYRVEHEFEGIGRRVTRINAKRLEHEGDGGLILVAIHDDTERERLQFEIEGRVEFAEKLIDSVREALLILHWDLRVHSANQVFYDLFNVDRSGTEGLLVYELGNGQWDIPELRRLLEDILPREQAFDDYEVHHTFETIGRRVMLLNGRRLDHLNLIVLAIRDVTAQQREEQERLEREAALRNSEARLETVTRFAPIGIGMFDRGGQWVFKNPVLEAMQGSLIPSRDPELIGRWHAVDEHGNLLPPEKWPGARVISGERVVPGIDFRTEINGEARWVNVAAVPIADGDHGGLAVAIITDITERKSHEQQVQLLMREVNHRSKNMLGLIQSIAHQTAAHRAGDFLENFDERIQSLAASQDLLIRSEWKAVPIIDLVRSQLALFADLKSARIAFDGPPLLITAEAMQAISMALHELATNAVKYGALSNECGRVTISWQLESDDPAGVKFVMSWSESGGPPVSAPTRRGFGTSVITSAVEMGLRGTVSLDFASTGFAWKMACEARHIVEGDAQPHRDTVSASRPESMAKRVLAVEDEPILATDLAGILADDGFDVIGPAGNVAHALSLIDEKGCDAAILDVNLRRETSEPVAKKLNEKGIPFVVVTGFSHTQLADVFRSAPLISKPYRKSALRKELRRLLESPGRDE
ncbi:MAG: HWE histidine kinase domain-containing protein [Hyphomicrobiaceae bacterium]